jgi:hypothetical protein
MAASKSPFAETGKVRRSGRCPENTQHFPPLNSLPCHSFLSYRIPMNSDRGFERSEYERDV